MASNSSNVVSLNRHHQSQKIFSPAEAAALINSSKATASKQLKNLFQYMFDNVDDLLFSLADKAENNTIQQHYFEAMREVRFKKESMDVTFNEKFNSLFNESLNKAGEQPQNFSFNTESLDGLLLVGDDELEESLAVTNMIAKSNNLFRESIYALEQRLSYLAATTQHNKDENPLGPSTICNAFKAAIQVLDSEIKVKLIVYKLFDKYIIQNLGGVYDEINKKLIEAGVLPNIKVKVRKQNYVTPRPDARNQSNEIIDGLPGGTVYEDVGYGYPSQGGVFGTLQNLLNQQRSTVDTGTLGTGGGTNTGGPGAMAGYHGPAYAGNASGQGGVAGLFETPDILSALSVLQQNSNVHPLHGEVQVNGQSLKLNIAGEISKIHGDEQSKSINGVDADTIDIVSMMFDFILEDRNLPDNIKALISRLQIPMLKVAIIDKEFFSKKTHPARRLLNELATAGIEWDEEGEREEDSLYKKVDYVVNRVLNDFEKDMEIFSQLLDEFVAFRDEEQLRLREAKAKLENAKLKIAAEIESRIVYEMPEVIRNLLMEPWKEVLTAIYDRDGDESPSWQTALQLADDLIWSVQPKISHDERQKLVQTIPKVLNGLQDGLTLISYDRDKKEILLEELEAFHMASLRGVDPIQSKPGIRPKPATNSASVDKLGIDDLDSFLNSSRNESGDGSKDIMEEIVLEEEAPILDNVVDVGSEWHEECIVKVRQLQLGAWVEFYSEDGKRARGKLAWKSEVMGEYTFVDRKYKVVADKTLRELSGDFYHGRAAIVENLPLIDRALDAVLNGLKKCTTRNKNEPDLVENETYD